MSARRSVDTSVLLIAGRVNVRVVATLDGFMYGEGAHMAEVESDPADFNGDTEAAERDAIARALRCVASKLANDGRFT